VAFVMHCSSSTAQCIQCVQYKSKSDNTKKYRHGGNEMFVPADGRFSLFW